MNPKILLMPDPLTPGDLWYYRQARRKELLRGGLFIKKFWRNTPLPKQVVGAEEVVRFSDIREHPAIQPLNPDERRWYTWAHFGPEQQRRALVHYLRKEGLGAGVRWLSRVQKLVDDPWREGEIVPYLPAISLQSYPNLPVGVSGKRHISLPILKSDIDAVGKKRDEEVVDSTTKVLDESMIFHLVGKTLILAVGGPPGSGKSTFAVSLADMMMNLVRDLRSRGWTNLPDIWLETSDIGTPVVDAIVHGEGKDRQLLARRKVKWNEKTTTEALRRLDKAKGCGNLIITDLPGGAHRWLAACADFGFIISNDWSKVPEWRDLFKSFGVSVVGQARSRPLADGFPSIVSTYKRGSLISGRVTDLDRVGRSWDPFTSHSAAILLFDILPTLVERKEKYLANI